MVVLNRSAVVDAVAAITKLPSSGLVGGTPPPLPLERATFAPQVGSRVSISGTHATVDATLVEIGELKGAAAGDATRFSLILEAKAGELIPQAVYRIHSTKLGAHDLFVVPVDRGVRSQQYQITVNNPARAGK
jgi:hypothetical protein